MIPYKQYNALPTLKKLPELNAYSEDFVSDLEFIYSDPVKAEANAFMKYDISLLVEYLELSHKEYIEVAIPNILNSFNQLLKNAPDSELLHKLGPIMLYGFREDVKAHFKYEEQNLFPYARALKESLEIKGYSTSEFERNHPQHIVDIDRLIMFFEILSPELNSFMTYRILKKRLDDLKLDFDVHGLVEDGVLIPKLKELEA